MFCEVSITCDEVASLIFFISVLVGSEGSHCWSTALHIYFHSLYCVSSIWLLQYLSWAFLGWNEALVQSQNTFAVQLYPKSLLVCSSWTMDIMGLLPQ